MDYRITQHLIKGHLQMRISKTKLREKIARLQNQGADVEIGWAYGQPRITNKSESRDLSPRLPASSMNEWIDGFSEGYNMANERNRANVNAIRDELMLAGSIPENQILTIIANIVAKM
jgi:hypothetical protein